LAFAKSAVEQSAATRRNWNRREFMGWDTSAA
jgi:hypothetical protein